MNTRSVRFKLTIWYTFSFFIAAFVIFTSFYLVTKQALFNQIDSTLILHENKVEEIITRSGLNMHESMLNQAFLTEFSEIPGMLLVVMNDSRNIFSNIKTSESSNMLFNQLFENSREKNQPFFINSKLEKVSVRFYVNPISQKNKLVAVVLIGHSVDVIEKSLTSLLIMLGVVFGIFTIPTIIGGSLLARGATQEITEISEKIKKITSENLDQRVASPNTGDEIEELASTFNNLLERLNESFNRERQFIGDVAHELKTPLATSRSAIEITLAKERTNKEYKNVLANLLIDNNKISSTLKNILDLAWFQAGNAKREWEPFDLSELLTELQDIASKMVYMKEITIEGNIEPNITISGRRDKLERAIINIIDNAIKYTKSRGKISIMLSKNKNKALITIKDTGIGISPKDLSHIFERFYRGTRTDKTFGSGLGLAIAKGIITTHRGEIQVESRVGKGAIFKIYLPLK